MCVLAHTHVNMNYFAYVCKNTVVCKVNVILRINDGIVEMQQITEPTWLECSSSLNFLCLLYFKWHHMAS